MSFGAAAQQAGVSQSDLARYAYARGMEPPFSAQTVAEELSETAHDDRVCNAGPLIALGKLNRLELLADLCRLRPPLISGSAPGATPV